MRPATTGFNAFKSGFPYQGKALYETLFERNRDRIRTNKAKFAVANLEKIFTATFEVAPRIGFPVMSLRDLCRETGLSMGGIYSYIESKERIAIMVKDVVKLVTDELVERAAALDDPVDALESAIREHIYATEILKEWFSFLYFETRSLPHEHQEESKNIEITLEARLRELIERIRANQKLSCENSPIIATTLVALIQDRYLKPWKHSVSGETPEQYAERVLALAHCAIEHP